MKLFGKIALWIVVALAITLVGVSFFVDFSEYARPELERLKRETGFEITNRSIKARILPTPRLVAYDLVVTDKQKFSRKESSLTMALRVKSLALVLSVRSLLFGKLVVDAAIVDKAELDLEKGSNDSVSPNAKAPVKDNAPSEPMAENLVMANLVASIATVGKFVKNIYIYDSTVTYADRNSKTFDKLERMDLEFITDPSPNLYRLNAEFRFERVTVAVKSLLDFSRSAKESIASLLANVSTELSGGKIHSELKGVYDLRAMNFKGSLKSILGDLLASLNLPRKKLDFGKDSAATADIAITADKIALENVKIISASAEIDGSAIYDFKRKELSGDLDVLAGKDKISLGFSTLDTRKISYRLGSASYREFMNWFTESAYLNDLAKPIALKGELINSKKGIELRRSELSFGEATLSFDLVFKPLTGDLALKGTARSIEKWGEALGARIPLVGDLNVRAALKPSATAFDLKADLVFAKGALSFDGKAFDKEILAKGKFAAKRFVWGDSVIDAIGDINVTPKRVALDLKNSRIETMGKFDMVVAKAGLGIDLGDKPHVSGDVSAKYIRFTSSKKPYLKKTALYDDFAYELKTLAGAAAPRWSKERFDPKLDFGSIDARIESPVIAIGEITFEGARFGVKLSDAKLSIPFKAKLGGGDFEAELRLSNENALNFSLESKFDGVNVAAIPLTAARFKRGVASGKLTSRSSGGDQYELVRNLGGAAEFKLTDGVIEGIDLAQAVRVAKKPLSLLDSAVQARIFGGGGRTEFKRLSADFVIKGGIASTSGIVFDAADANLKATGVIDLSRWNLNLKGEANFPTLKGLPPLGFTVDGSLSDPKYRLNTESLAKALAPRGIDLVQNILGGSKKDGQKIKPEKIVKSIMDIFGKRAAK